MTDIDQDDFQEEEVEQEIGNDDVVINVPFNPSKIKVNTRSYSVGQIINDLNDSVIDFETEFQRLPGLWDDQKKSRFIESLLLNLPIPAFYFSEREENDWEVVDGLQRVSTLKQFVIENNLELKNLEFLTDYNNLRYNDLPVTLQKRITRFPITLYLIEKGTPDDVKYNIFKRINQGGLVLEPQEIRHAINQGRPSEFIADLVRGHEERNVNGTIKTRRNRDGSVTELRATPEGIAFRRATDNRIRSKRMEDRDFATRFVAFYLISYKEYEPDMDSFMNKGMAKINELTTSEISMLKSRFLSAMNLVYDVFGRDSFRKRFNRSHARKPINKALFEVLSVSFAHFSPLSAATLYTRKDDFIDRLIDLHNQPDGKFLRSITQGTAQKETVEQRFTAIRRILLEIVPNAELH